MLYKASKKLQGVKHLPHGFISYIQGQAAPPKSATKPSAVVYGCVGAFAQEILYTLPSIRIRLMPLASKYSLVFLIILPSGTLMTF